MPRSLPGRAHRGIHQLVVLVSLLLLLLGTLAAGQCSNATDCNGRAKAGTSIAGSTPNCLCVCMDAYTSADCTSCSTGHTNYPSCHEDCTLTTVSCNGHASQVTGVYPSCVCTCNTGWAGARCDRCQPGYILWQGNCIGDPCSREQTCNDRGTINTTDCSCTCTAPGHVGARCGECMSGFALNADGTTCINLCTSVDASCNGHASSVQPNPSLPSICDCACDVGYRTGLAETCASCADHYTLNGTECIDACTSSAVSCNGHGTPSANTDKTCSCACNTGFDPTTKCATCAAGYFGPSSTSPFCHPDNDCLTVTGTCHDRASAIDTGSCRCTCLQNYTGSRCEQCDVGYTGWPNCVEDCTNTTITCNGQATAVRPHSALGVSQCVCTCNALTGGSRCERCRDGYTGSYPAGCVDPCANVIVSCLNGATSVAGSNGACTCTCRAGFSGSRCQLCAPGYSGYPDCQEDCSSTAVSCNGHATAVAGSRDTAGRCQCTCAFNWAGHRCNQCARGYVNTTAGCTTCATGFAAAAAGKCVEDCTDSAATCSSNGSPVAVNASIGLCSCSCWNSNFANANCSTCKSPGFIMVANGSSSHACVADTCSDVAISCNGNALSVSGTLAPSCACICKSNYTGSRCERCRDGYTGWPVCTATCHNATVCNSRASSWNGTVVSNCSCSCLRGYAGATCSQCAAGFTGYPTCIEECTNVTVSCGSSRGLSVSGVPGKCVCSCRHPYAGPQCASCVAGFRVDPAAAAASCVADNCTLDTISASCNGKGVNVTGPAGSCKCTCQRGYGGDRCDRCAAGFVAPLCYDRCEDPALSCGGHGSSFLSTSPMCVCRCDAGYFGQFCDRCASGFKGFPNCTDDCTNTAASCNDHASSLSTNADGSCRCTCRTGYDGTKCDRCAAGYNGYPNCAVDDCSTNTGSCNGNALNFSGTNANCACQCKANFTGSNCEVCAAGYGQYPQCFETCTLTSVSCSGHASSVANSSVDAITGAPRCACQCLTGYTGARCDQCIDGFNQSSTEPGRCDDLCANATSSCLNGATEIVGSPPNCQCTCPRGFTGSRCQFCAPGFSGYPNCFEDCTSISVSCHSRATEVFFRRPTCDCRCMRGWAGDACDECAAGWVNDPAPGGLNCSKCEQGYAEPDCTPCAANWGGSDCQQCATGFDRATNCTACVTGYGPLSSGCPESCSDSTVSCSGRGIVTGASSTGSGCNCVCNAGYAGDRCGRCAFAYILFQGICVLDQCNRVDVSCNDHASAVTFQTLPNCVCTCSAGYTGSRCDECAVGFSGYPNCAESCTDGAVSCNGKASAVQVSTTNSSECACTCSRGYSGKRCDVCAIGFFGFPDCRDECTDLVASCGLYAVSQSGTLGACTCTCKPGYGGDTCAQCAAGFTGFPSCVADVCTNVSATCSGRGVSIRDVVPGNCTCNCLANYTGDRCTACAQGYIATSNSSTSSPRCEESCTNTTVSCNGNAGSVIGTAPDCTCYCKAGYDGLRCDNCAIGYSGYPSCGDACTLPAVSCNGNGFAVSGPNATGHCSCTCSEGYAGSTCDRCAAGYGGYPICAVDNCDSVQGSCNGNAFSVSGTAPNCTCQCKFGYTGARCDACAAGYARDAANACVEDCSSVAVSCYNLASSVRKVGPDCVCTCRQGYSGSRCDQCAVGFDPAPAWPACYNRCENPLTSCSGQGVNVTGTDQNCRCTCKQGFSGSICQTCAAGYILPPNCYDDCQNLTRSCNAQGTASISVSTPQCTCNCRAGWAGPKCGTCATGWTGATCNACHPNFRGTDCGICQPQYRGTECSVCNIGYTNSPTCNQCQSGYQQQSDGTCLQQCTVATTCNGRAWNVSATPPCVCNCKHGFGGTRCERCEVGFAPDGACDRCASPGFTSDFPTCTNLCTNTDLACLGHGTSVAAHPSGVGCQCTCLPSYAGTDCSRCAAGYSDYPTCSEDCTSTAVSCSGGIGASVSGLHPSCQCKCPTAFAGSRCERCAPGYFGHPTCVEDCTNATVSCNGHGSPGPVGGNPALGCACTCIDGFTGSRCDRCTAGYYGYPNCVVEDCTDQQVSCNGNGLFATGIPPNCSCASCKPGYAGSRCDTCADGYSGYPVCRDSCTNVNVSCTAAGRATAVALKPDGSGGCLCSCILRYRGDRCQVCNRGWKEFACAEPLCNDIGGNCWGHATAVTQLSPMQCQCTCQKNFTGLNCEVCAQGYSNWPACTDACTEPSVSCYAPGALSVSGIGPDFCTCTCRTGYAGLRCERCASGYGGWPNCVLRDCLTVVSSCNDRASTVSGNPPNCQCNCFPGYAGTFCERCATGYTDWPNCRPDCQDVTTSCSGRATGVTNSTTGTGCTCQCMPMFSGPRCEYCASGYLTAADGSCVDDCRLASVSCSGHAPTPVRDATTGQCTCNCFTGFDGPKCDRCRTPQYVGYPACDVNDCLTAASCNNHGLGTGGIPGTCSCVCQAPYTGAQCTACAAGYANYPDCVPDCTTTAGSCNAHATAVSKDPATGTCICTCEAAYTGAACENCAAGYAYDAAQRVCVPDCTNVTTACNNHALLVDGIPNGCVCYCKAEFAGATCGQCATGRGGYPICALDDCSSVAGSCNNRATSVLTGSSSSDCICTCTEGHAGARCEACAPGYTVLDAADANICLNDCSNITVSCSGKATSVARASTFGSAQGQQHCTCACLTAFDGPTCNRCAAGYAGFPNCIDACTEISVSCVAAASVSVTGANGVCQCQCKVGATGQYCDRCLAGYGGHPTCVDDCTNPLVSCNNHGATVTGNWPSCVCPTCLKGFDGPKCDRCATGYENYPTCSDRCAVSTTCSGNAEGVSGTTGNCVCACKTGYAPPDCSTCRHGYGGNPCADNCQNVTVSCGANGQSVTTAIMGCRCTCKRGWGGAKCDVCATGFAGITCAECARGFTGANCDTCSAGFSGSNCDEDCTSVSVSCNGRASAVTTTALAGVCTCSCLDEFDGLRCESCAEGYNGPQCTDACTNVNVSCGGRATSVFGTAGVCTCQCKPNFQGFLCDSCAPKFETGVPECLPDCTDPLTSCGPHAVSVNGSDGNCTCTCKHGYTGPACAECAIGFGGFPSCVETCVNLPVSCHGHAAFANQTGSGGCACSCLPGYAGQRCDECAVGFAGYPNCTDACTDVSVSCTSGAVSVNRSAPALGSSCNCICRDGLTGSTCENCAARITNHPACDVCEHGYENFPLCEEACTNRTISCNGRGTPSGALAGCACACDVSFSGNRCERCATGYTAGVGGYPDCRDDCTVDAVSCGGLGVIRSGSNATRCTCDCRARYTGARCDACADGYHNYPSCSDACTNLNVSCNANFSVAVARSAVDSNICLCACKPGYSGARCDACAAGFTGFPDCSQDCSVANVSCNGRALDVSGTAPNCACTCLPGYNASTMCATCTDGFTGFPQCTDACVLPSVSCVGPATHVSLNVTTRGCRCTCASALVAGDRCDECAAGYSGFPSCVEDCSDIDVSCNGAADTVAKAVSYTPAAPTCRCTCNLGFAGSKCERCATGYGGWPQCVEDCSSTDVSCNGHGLTVAGTTGACVCTCKEGFTGLTCDRCKAGYGPYPTCVDNCTSTFVSCANLGEFATAVNGSAPSCTCSCAAGFGGRTCDRCQAGYSGFPDCRESCNDAVASCNGNAQAVAAGPGSTCLCTCFPAFAGDRCNKCSEHHVNYPTCGDNCSSVAVSCGARGTAVATDPSSSTCQCTCVQGYTGAQCARCAAGYARLNAADVSAPCIDACTVASASCSAHAVSVRVQSASGGANGGPLCVCTCMANFTGRLCDACAPGYGGYPNCVEDCSSGAASCNNRSVAVRLRAASELVNGTTDACDCLCRDRFAGARCDRCAAGYTSYPLCVDGCSNASVSCGSRALSVGQSRSWTFLDPTCACRCLAGYGNGTGADATTCDVCATGFTGFPSCVTDCVSSVNTNCGEHADGVAPTSLPGVCRCTCKRGFAGARCDACAPGFGGFPNCRDSCTLSSVSCSGNGTLVAGGAAANVAGAACECTCPRPGMAGGTGRCQTCKTTGYRSDYPNCTESCTSPAVSCSGKAAAVLPSATPTMDAPCECFCDTGFTGPRCGVCATGYGPEFPTCRPGAAVVFRRGSPDAVDGTAIRTDATVVLAVFNITTPLVRFVTTSTAIFDVCLRMTVRRDSAARGAQAPLGLESRLHSNMLRRGGSGSSFRVGGANSTLLSIVLFQDPDYDSAFPEHVDFSLGQECFTPPGNPEPTGSMAVRVDPPEANVVLRAATSGLAGTAGAAALVSASPAAIVDMQSIAILALMGCADAGSRGIADATSWLLAPFAIGGGPMSLLVGAVLPLIIVVVVHALVCASTALARHGVPSPAGSLRNRQPFRAAAAAVGFPGLSLLAVLVLFRGVLFGAMRVFVSDTADVGIGGVLVASLAMMLVVAVLAGVAIAAPVGTFALTYVAESKPPTSAVLRFFVPKGRWQTDDGKEETDPTVGGLGGRYALAFFEVCKLGYAGLLPLHAAVVVVLSSAWAPTDIAGCRAQYAVLAVWYLVAAAVIARGSPFVSPFLNWTGVGFNVLLCILCIAGAIRHVALTEIMVLLVVLFSVMRGLILVAVFLKTLVVDPLLAKKKENETSKPTTQRNDADEEDANQAPLLARIPTMKEIDEARKQREASKAPRSPSPPQQTALDIPSPSSPGVPLQQQEGGGEDDEAAPALPPRNPLLDTSGRGQHTDFRYNLGGESPTPLRPVRRRARPKPAALAQSSRSVAATSIWSSSDDDDGTGTGPHHTNDSGSPALSSVLGSAQRRPPQPHTLVGTTRNRRVVQDADVRSLFGSDMGDDARRAAAANESSSRRFDINLSSSQSRSSSSDDLVGTLTRRRR